MAKQFITEAARMQKLAGVTSKSQIKEEKYADNLTMIQNIVDNWADGGIDSEPAMIRIDKILLGNYEDEDGEGF